MKNYVARGPQNTARLILRDCPVLKLNSTLTQVNFLSGKAMHSKTLSQLTLNGKRF